MVIPRAPSYLGKSLLGSATVEYMEPRTHYLELEPGREFSGVRIPVDGKGAKRGHDDRLLFRSARFVPLPVPCLYMGSSQN